MDVKKAGLDSGNIWLMPNIDEDVLYKEMSGDILAGNEFSSLFISCPSLKDPVSYNGRHHILEIITFIDYNCFSKFKDEVTNKHSPEYFQFKERICEKLLNTLEKVVPGIRNNVVQMELGTPMTNEHYINATRGNVYGTEKGFFQTGPFSYTPQTEIDNLFMCGASIMSHGVAGASYSGVKTAAKVLDCREEDLIKPDSAQEVRVYDAEDDSLWPEWLHQKIADKKKRIKEPVLSK